MNIYLSKSTHFIHFMGFYWFYSNNTEFFLKQADVFSLISPGFYVLTYVRVNKVILKHSENPAVIKSEGKTKVENANSNFKARNLVIYHIYCHRFFLITVKPNLIDLIPLRHRDQLFLKLLNHWTHHCSSYIYIIMNMGAVVYFQLILYSIFSILML